MPVSANQVVSFTYRLSEVGGAQLESSDVGMPMVYLHGHNNLLPALEAALEGLNPGDNKRVELEAAQAFGPRRDNAEQKVPVKHLIGHYKRLLPGMLVKVNTPDGARDARVIKAGKFMVELDTNHPFAGKALIFDVTIESLRDATPDEIAHGHAHGIGGHQH
jgi:FKBP-type peptidyl-prolyl cis-trans isomerase SlyD